MTSELKEPAKAEDRQRGWVRREIAGLDPEIDYERIVHLIAEWEMTEFAINLGYAVQFQHVMIPVPGSDVLVGTGKVINRPQTRFFDSIEFAAKKMIDGPSHPDMQKTLDRLNAIHAGVAKKFPASFENNDDWIYTFCFLICQTDRMRDLVGAPRQARARQIAFHHFWRDIASMMRAPHGSFGEFPATYEAAEAFLDEFESRDWAPTPKGKIVSDAIIAQFSERFFPGPVLRPVGRAVVLAFVRERVRLRHGIPAVNPVLMWLVRRAFRLMFLLEDRGLPERKTPLSAELETAQYKERRSYWRKQERTAATPACPYGAAGK